MRIDYINPVASKFDLCLNCIAVGSTYPEETGRQNTISAR